MSLKLESRTFRIDCMMHGDATHFIALADADDARS